MTKSQFHRLIAVQHIAIRIPDQNTQNCGGGQLKELPEIERDIENNNMEAEEEGAEEKSDHSGDEELAEKETIKGQTYSKKPGKILIAVLSPDGCNLAIGCQNNEIAMYQLMQSPETSRYLFDPTYRLLSHNNPCHTILQICWSLVASSLPELIPASRSKY